MAGGDADNPSADVERLLREIAATRMPFGKYGPQHYPPSGVPVMDLPYEYLSWFARQGFPKGKLGTMLKIVWQAKGDGADAMFDPLRDSQGGRTSLRGQRRKHWEFPGNEEGEE